MLIDFRERRKGGKETETETETEKHQSVASNMCPESNSQPRYVP